jgi:hypothetical protein
MTVLLESPWPAIFFGIIAEAVLAVILVRTGRGAVLLGMLGVLALSLAGVGLERLVVTERERVEATLYGAADAIEHNDADGVVSWLSPTGQVSPSWIRGVMKRYRFTDARINNLQVEINHMSSPPTAKARMIAAFSVAETHGASPYNNARLGLTVELRLENGRWLITGHSQGDPRDYL